jgi:benzoate/toluate 1,2-dioxygenase beta subunit
VSIGGIEANPSSLSGDAVAEIQNFLYTEARLLDESRLQEWLSLFTHDAVYWIPTGIGAPDPDRTVSIVYDDRARMNERVWRLESGLAYAQEPQSKTARVVGNVQIEAQQGDVVITSSSFILVELRRGVQSVFAGRYEHHLRRVDGRLMIERKRVDLLNNNEPIGNLSFIV